jgi:hypothetical protein
MGDEKYGIAEFEYGKDGNIYPHYDQDSKEVAK